MARYETALLVKCIVFFYKMVIYSDSVSYVFSARPSEILSLGKYTLEVWLDISVRTKQEDVKHQFYWLSLKKDVGKIVGQCRMCQLVKQQK